MGLSGMPLIKTARPVSFAGSNLARPAPDRLGISGYPDLVPGKQLIPPLEKAGQPQLAQTKNQPTAYGFDLSPQPVAPNSGRAIPTPGKQPPVQMHGIYTNNPSFTDHQTEYYAQMRKLPWSDFYKAQPPADLRVAPAKVDTQLKTGGWPYGIMAKVGALGKASTFLPMTVPAVATPQAYSLATGAL